MPARAEREAELAQPETYLFADDGAVPNNTLPLLIHRAALPADAAGIERAFARHGWPPAWRNGVYPWHHFHPSAHEALGVASGTARVLFGGAGGTALDLAPGDVIVIPAGVGHCALAASADLVIVGAYPAGTQDHAARKPDAARHARYRADIAAVPHPGRDPATGGPIWPAC